MIFGRKRKQDEAAQLEEDVVAPEVAEQQEAAEIAVEEVEEDVDDVEASLDEDDVEADLDEDDEDEQWSAWDAAFDREEGPFDIEEVDLDADDIERLDLGSLIVTPFEKMTMQLQVEQSTQNVQAILVADGASALEVAVFAGPVRTSMTPEIREEIIASTQREKGEIAVVEGPFGAELRRRLPITDPQGNPAIHVSRTWLVSGPGWVLRGVLMGRAALQPQDEEAQVTLFECFSNLVVRRGAQPAAPGSLLPMTVPNVGN